MAADLSSEAVARAARLKHKIIRDISEISSTDRKLSAYFEQFDSYRLFLKDSLIGEDPDREPGEPSLAARLASLSKILFQFAMEHGTDCSRGSCLAGVDAKPWFTFVILNTISSRAGFDDGQQLFYSFGIVDENAAEKWYVFLREQGARTRDPRRSFIISNLIYRNWTPGAPSGASRPENFFRFVQAKGHRFAKAPKECVDIVVVPERPDNPLSIRNRRACPEFVKVFSDWRKKTYDLNRTGEEVFPGLWIYLQEIEEAMGLETGEPWLLWAFPVPAIGTNQLRSGLYLRTGLNGMCDSAFGAISFLLSSTLWPVDYLMRQRTDAEQVAAKIQVEKARVASLKSAVREFDKRIGKIEADFFSVEASRRSTFQRFLQGLDELRERSDQSKSLRNIKSFQESLEQSGVTFDNRPFAKTLASLEEGGANESLKHFLTHPESQHAERFVDDVESIANALLALEIRYNPISDLTKALVSALSQTIPIKLDETTTQAWPLVLSSELIKPEALTDLLENPDRIRGLSGRRFVLTLRGREWGVQLALVYFVLESLFEPGGPRRMPMSNVALEFDGKRRWFASWRTSSTEQPKAIRAIRMDSSTERSSSKVSNRLALMRYLEIGYGKLSLDKKESTMHLALDFGRLLPSLPKRT